MTEENDKRYEKWLDATGRKSAKRNSEKNTRIVEELTVSQAFELLVGFMSERYHYHVRQSANSFNKEESILIKMVFDNIGLEFNAEKKRVDSAPKTDRGAFGGIKGNE